MNQSEQIDKLASALAKCQGEMEPAIKDSTNPHFKSKYADLNAVWAACRQPLSKNGLCVVQTIDTLNEKMVLITTLLHTSGQWIRSTMPVVTAKFDAQGIGSGLSYARRYSLSAMCGISQDDDDGQAAMPREEKKRPKEEPKLSPLITENQSRTLSQLSELCDPAYVTTLMDYLAKDNISSFSTMPQSYYKKCIEGLNKNAEAYQKTIEGQTNG
jgi:hypothetical protein